MFANLTFLHAFECAFSASWSHLGPSWRHLGAILERFGAILAFLEASWGVLEALGASWGCLGRSWGRLGEVFGRLGRSWVRLEWLFMLPGGPWGDFCRFKLNKVQSAGLKNRSGATPVMVSELSQSATWEGEG